jgi:predicted O-methyltransferase YrrM
MEKIFVKILKIHPPSYRILKSIYSHLKGRKYLNYNLENDLKYNEDLLSSLELDVKFIKSILIKYGLNYHDQDLSWQYHLFAGFKRKFEERNIKIDKILEIGTLNGEFTNFLSEIFPNSEIISIDLNENDHSFTSSYNREDPKKLSKLLEVRKKNLDKKNIKFIIMNSLELRNNFKSNFFDLIWIDGDHFNPQVTIDIFQSLKLIKKNGIICVDDVIKDDDILKNKINNQYVSSESFKTLEYFSNLEYLKTKYLIKRIRGSNLGRKKYISISSLKDFILDNK